MLAHWQTEPVVTSGLTVGLARNAADLRAAQRLPYRVFAEEQGAHVPGGRSGLDCDELDFQSDHLIVRDRATGEVVLPPFPNAMLTDCSALPSQWSARTPRFGWRTAVARRHQWSRFVRLCVHVLRMWLGALLLGGRLSERWREPIVRHFSARLLAILGVRIEVRGAVPASAWPVLMLANHVSWLDSYVVNTFHGARFVAKSEVARWPLIGTIARRFETLFIVRQSIRSAARTKDAMAQLLRRGIPVAIFPEGTTTDGRTVRPFYPALLQAAIDANVPVQPVAIAYRGRDGRPTTAAAFIDDLSILSSLRQILREGELVAEVTFCQPLSARGQTRREVAHRTRRMVANALDIPLSMLEPDRPAPRVARPLVLYPAAPAVAPTPPAGLGERWQLVRNALRMAHHGSVARG